MASRIPVATGLTVSDFKQIAARGFGDQLNAYAHSMTWFQDKLYVGTTRANLCLIRVRNPPMMQVWPVKCPQYVYELDLRAQIWSYDPRAGTWELVHVSPIIIGNDGREIPREVGYRGMAAFGKAGGGVPGLYVGTWSPSRGPGGLILHSPDGKTFTPVSRPGLGYENVVNYRALTPFNGCLYVSPTGGTGGRANTAGCPLVLESDNPMGGDWHEASLPGFGNLVNLTVFQLAEFNGHLYAGTMNAEHGFEIWKSKCEGTPPYAWTKVLENGAYRGSANEVVISMVPFGDALYIGGGIQGGGFDRINQVGPAAAELLRLYPDDSWDIVVGEERTTPDGLKRPLSGIGPGFDNFFNAYIWSLCVYEGWLYVGTYDWSIFLPYLPIERLPDRFQRILRRLGAEALVKFEGGFDLWRTCDGVQWAPVTTTGFDNPYNFGVRNMVATPAGLFVGSANPFGPEVAIKGLSGWEYVPNPHGGLEVWLGRHTDREAKRFTIARLSN